ncbi:major facilitator superfamily domain-containing protein [Powellomyces hirtus]|nr:major facilitator superfamily domain-containing protein [Powellomyces hirtus]
MSNPEVTTVISDPLPLYHQSIKINADSRSQLLESDEQLDAASLKSVPRHDTIPAAPDGGYGWVVVLSQFLFNFVVFGTNNIWGVYQRSFFQTDHIKGATMVQLSFVGGVGLGLIFLFGPVVGWMQARFGTRSALFLGTILMALGLELSSLATQIWHLFLSLSIMWGSGCSLLFLGSVAIPAQWFSKKRALATGLASSGSGFGGLVFAPVAQALIDRYGVSWCLRIMGFVTLALGLFASATMKTFQKPAARPATQARRRHPFDPAIMSAPGFKWLLAFAFVNLFGFIIPFYFLPAYATSIGVSAQTGATLVAIVSGVNAMGRILSGFLGDAIGRINAGMILVFLSGITCFAIWTFANTFAVLLVFTIAYGLLGGAYWALITPMTAEVVGLAKLPGALSIVFLTNVIPLIFAGPIASAIYTSTGSTSYIGSILFTGSVLCAGAMLLSGTKLAKNKNIWAKV